MSTDTTVLGGPEVAVLDQTLPPSTPVTAVPDPTGEGIHEISPWGVGEVLTLDRVLDRIKAEYSYCMKLADGAVRHARIAGRCLYLAKDMVPRGEWGKWVEQNCGFSPETARGYMRVYREWDRLENPDDEERQPVTDLTLRGALKALAKPRPKPLPGPAGPPPAADATAVGQTITGTQGSDAQSGSSVTGPTANLGSQPDEGGLGQTVEPPGEFAEPTGTDVPPLLGRESLGQLGDEGPIETDQGRANHDDEDDGEHTARIWNDVVKNHGRQAALVSLRILDAIASGDLELTATSAAGEKILDELKPMLSD